MIIQEKNGINLTNVDIAKIAKLACHNKDGIIAGSYEECKLELKDGKLILHSGEIVVSGYVITLEDGAYVSINTNNIENGSYLIILSVSISRDTSVDVELYYTKNTTLVKDDILSHSCGIYMIEIGTFDYNNGTISNVKQTLSEITYGDGTTDIPIVCGSTNLGDINIDVKKLDIGKMYMYQCNYNAGHLPDGGGTGLRTILVYKLRDGYATMYVIPQCNADNKHLYQIVCDNNIWQFDKAVDLVGLSDSSNFAKLDDINTFTAVNNFHEINCKGLSCGNKRVSGVADPLISSDAINKQTLDAGLEKKADLSGATFTGAIKDKNNRPFNCVYLGQLSDAHIDVSSLETGYIYAGQAYDKNCRNCPSGSNGGLVVYYSYGGSYVSALFYGIGGNFLGRVLTSCYSAYTKKWGDWKQISTSEDLQSYLKLVGGTITGDINYKKAELRYNSLFYTPLVNDLNNIDLTTVPSGTAIHAFCSSKCKGLPKDYFKGTVKITCYTHGEDWATEELLPIVADDAGKRAQRVWAKASGWSEWYLFNGTANTAGNIT